MKLKENLIYLLLFLLPTQFGKHFFPPFSYVSGIRIDYLSPTIYLTDCIILLLIILSLKTFHIQFSKKLFFIFLLIFVNIIFSLSPWISFYKWIKLAEVFILFFLLKPKLNIKYILLAFTGGALLQFILVIFQITQQHTMQGFAYFLGERYFSISTPGIAKTTLQGVEILRGYGSFSHPNSLAGFFLLLYTYVLFEKKFNKHIYIKYFFIALSTLLILLSFSKIVIVTFLLVTAYFTSKYISCKFCAWGRIIVLSVLSLLFISAQGDPESIQKRIYLLQNSFQTIIQYPLFGTGLGAYLVAQSQFPIPYSYLFFQPVHNVLLLFLAETGVILTGILVYILSKLIKPFLKNELGLILLLVIFITGFFDHYWLTLQQNILLIPVVFCLLKKQKWS